MAPEQRKRHFAVDGAGHYGIFSGRRWREQVYPRVREFIATHSSRSQVAEPAPES